MAISDESCATCARYFSNIIPQYDEKIEKPKAEDKRLDCCDRVICGDCILKNSRFATYCPFCQISDIPSSLPQGLWSPPCYTSSSTEPPNYADELPSYTSQNTAQPVPPPEKLNADVLHFLDHSIDTVGSLSLRYHVPIAAIRTLNNITSDHLLLARRTILIPGQYYSGPSLSASPIEGEEEERKKGLIRKFMVGCKVPEYDIAILYLENNNWELELAMGTFRDDERWEREHPIKAGKGDGLKDVGRRRYTGKVRTHTTND